METVTIRRQDHYTMPRVCCACGAPAESGRLMTSGYSRGGVGFVNLSFPLCDRCALISKTINRRRSIARWAGLVSALVLVIVVSGIASVSGALQDISLFTFLGSIAILVPLALLGILIAQWLVSIVGLTSEVRKTFARVARAVKIKAYDADMWGEGYITFVFVDELFANRFRQMNRGVVLPGKLSKLGMRNNP